MAETWWHSLSVAPEIFFFTIGGVSGTALPLPGTAITLPLPLPAYTFALPATVLHTSALLGIPLPGPSLPKKWKKYLTHVHWRVEQG